MTSKPPRDRIVVALDSAHRGRAILEAAAEIAGRLRAELVAVYVEDVEILHMAGLPFARESSIYSTLGRSVDAPRMERTLRAAAARLRAGVAAAADRLEVPWSFRVVRGRVANELLAVASEAEMLILGRPRVTQGRGKGHSQSTAVDVMTLAEHTVVLVPHGQSLDRPVLAVFDAAKCGERVVEMALRLATGDPARLTVVVPARDSAAFDARRKELIALLGEAAGSVRIVAAPDETLGAVVDALRRERCRTLIVHARSPLLAAASPSELLDSVDCPLIIVR